MINYAKVYIAGCIALVIIAFLLSLGHLTAGHNWGGDFAQYIMQAQSIVDGTVDSFLESNRWMIETSDSNRPIGPVAYPWGLSLLLAPLYALLGVNLTAFKLVGVVSFSLFVWVYGGYVRRYHSTWTVLLLVAIFAVNPALHKFLNQIASDIPFMLVSMVCVLLVTGRGGEPSKALSIGQGVLMGLMIGIASLLRTNGILLIIPLAACQFGAWLVSNRNGPGIRAGFRSLLTFTHAAPWLVFGMVYLGSANLLPEGGSSHTGHMEFVNLMTIWNNIVYYIKLPLAFYEGVPGRFVICLLTYPLLLIGLFARLRTDYPVILYFFATLGVYIIWPDAMQGLRFLFPLLPIYLSLCVTGFDAIVGFLPPAMGKMTNRLGIGWLLYVALFMGISSSGAAWRNLQNERMAPEGPYTDAAIAMFSEVNRLTKANDHLVFFKPRVMHFMTGRRSTTQRDLSRVPPGAYVVLYRDEYGLTWPMGDDALRDAVTRGRARHVYQEERFAIYQLKP